MLRIGALPGTYVIMCNVTDENGNVGSETLTYVANDITAPVVTSLVADITDGVDAPVVVNFTVTATDNFSTITYEWFVDDVAALQRIFKKVVIHE